MIGLLSAVGLLALWAILVGIETMPWPPKHGGLYSDDPEYLRAVVRESNAYLATHGTASVKIRRQVAGMAVAAQQKLGGLVR